MSEKQASSSNGDDHSSQYRRGEEPVSPDQNEENHSSPPSVADDVSETPTERYDRSVAQTKGTWFSGFFTGNSYLPHPKKIKEDELSDDAEEELLEEETYTVPRGYKYHEADLPPILKPKPTGKYKVALIIYLVFEIIAFVFLLVASCPVPWYKGKDVVIDGVDYKDTKYTLYKQSGGNMTSISLRGLRFCPREKQFFQGMAASNIMATVFTLIALILTIARLTGKTTYAWCTLFGFFGFIWALCANGMSISLYHIGRCDRPRFANMARLDAGFALSLIAWVLLFFGLLVMVFTTHLNFGPSIRKLRVMDSYYFLLLCISISFCCIGNVQTCWKRRFNTADVRVVRVNYWHTEVILTNGVNLIYGRAMYRCGAYNKRMKASVSFLILSTVFLMIAAMLAVPAFFKRLHRILSLVLCCCASAMLLISWVIAVVVKYRALCTGPVGGSLYGDYPGIPSGIKNGYTKFEGYGLAEGVVLPIVAWILCTLGIVLNFVVPWPPKK